MAFPDHHPYTAADAAAIEAVAKEVDADIIVTTEKDRARSGATLEASFPHAVLRVSLEVVRGREVVDEIAALKVPARRVSPR